MDLILKNVHAVDPQTGLDCVTDIAVKDGKIVKIGDCGGSAERMIDCSGLYAVPGLSICTFISATPDLPIRKIFSRGCRGESGRRYGRAAYAELKACLRYPRNCKIYPR